MIASSLFHFTKNSETIINIISGSKFRASYNIEDVSDFYLKEKYVAIPMVCFCDIPLKFISEHPMVYGDYGIGLKKGWGIAKGINPILYRTESQINKYLEAILSATQSTTTNAAGTFSLTVVQDNVLRLSNFTKKYKTEGIINYFDREWRFVPAISEMVFMKAKSKKERAKINSNYFDRSPDYIPFRLSDIRYIIAPSKRQVKNLIAAIQLLKMSNTQKYQLCQLIVDLKSIKKDF
jgi:hypothetical protein